MNPQTTSVKHATPGMFLVFKAWRDYRKQQTYVVSRTVAITEALWGATNVSCWTTHGKSEVLTQEEVGQLFGGN